jgi:hypothetical protein
MYLHSRGSGIELCFSSDSISTVSNLRHGILSCEKQFLIKAKPFPVLQTLLLRPSVYGIYHGMASPLYVMK